MLDVDSGLVSGVPLAHMDKTISIRVIRAFYYKGVLQPVGKVFDYPYYLAREAMASGKAERYEEPKAPAPEAPSPAEYTPPLPKRGKSKE